MDEITYEQLLSKTIQLKVRDIYKTKNIGGIIEHKLRKSEGTCNKYGYIINIQVIERSVGKVYSIDRESLIEYKINYKIKSILPKLDEEYYCIIGSITKMGIICYILMEGKEIDITNSPLQIIIPKELCEINKYKEGMKIKIIAVDFRIKFGATQIQVIGKIED